MPPTRVIAITGASAGIGRATAIRLARDGGALVLCAERYDSSDPVNVGSGEEIAIRDLATLIARATGYGGRFVWDPTQPNGQPRRRLDVTRARERFGFTAQVGLEEGIRRTVAFYEERYGGQRKPGA